MNKRHVRQEEAGILHILDMEIKTWKRGIIGAQGVVEKTRKQPFREESPASSHETEGDDRSARDSDDEDSDEEDSDEEDSNGKDSSTPNHKNKRDDIKARKDPRHERSPAPNHKSKRDDRESVHADSVNGDTKSQKSMANTPGWIRKTKRNSESIAGDPRKSSRSKSNHGDGKRDDKNQKGGESGKKDTGKRDTGKRDIGKSPESIKDSGKDGKKAASSSADKSRASPLKDIQEDSEGSEELDLQRADARRPKKSATIASDTPSKEPEKPKRKGEYTSKTVPLGAKVILPTRWFARKPRPEDARVAWIDPKVKVNSKKRANDWGYDI